MTILDEIIATKRRELVASKQRVSLASLEARLSDCAPTRGFTASLARRDAGLRIVAEVKKASPSKGLIRPDFDPVEIAKSYRAGGAAAISVLTDETYFQGHLAYLEAVRAEVDVPLLRKDFIVDEYQVVEARVAGADAILLILAASADRELRRLSERAASLGLDVLWEVHDEAELDRALEFAPRLLGINNRDLRTFDVRLETTRDLVSRVPAGVTIVSESGFFERHDIDTMLGWGAHAFLIGESLMRAPDPGAALRGLITGEEA